MLRREPYLKIKLVHSEREDFDEDAQTKDDGHDYNDNIEQNLGKCLWMKCCRHFHSNDISHNTFKYL